jgi:protease IV
MKKACLVATGVVVFLLLMSLVITLFQKSLPTGNRLALVRIEGPIMDSKSAVEEIRQYVKDGSIKGIVLRIDSPGGAVAPSQEIHAEVKKAAASKSVVVSMGSIAASGGYYIAVPATKILANPGTLTGSIGVIMEIPNLEGLMNKLGVKTEVIKSGKNKDIASAFRSMEKEERELLQGVMDNVHEQFIKAVSEGRKIGMDELREIADGRIFTGEQAQTYGLVDQLGTLDDAVKTAASLSGIKEEPEVIEKKDKLSVIELLRSKFRGEISGIFPSLKIKYLYSP